MSQEQMPLAPQGQTVADMIAELNKLKAENEAFKASGAKIVKHRDGLGNGLSARVSEGGTVRKDGTITEGGKVSVYGLNKQFPVTLSLDQWYRLFASMAQLRSFIEANRAKLIVKPTIAK